MNNYCFFAGVLNIEKSTRRKANYKHIACTQKELYFDYFQQGDHEKYFVVAAGPNHSI